MHSALIRNAGNDISLVTYGGSLPKVLHAARLLEQQGISADLFTEFAKKLLKELDT